MLAMKLGGLVLLISGYRHQGVDYHDDDFLFDVEMSHPVPGLTFRVAFDMNGFNTMRSLVRI